MLLAIDLVEKYTLQQCFSTTIAILSQEELEPAETSYLDAITNRGNRKEIKSWYIQLQMNGKNVCFKIDAGVEVSAISTDVFEAIGRPNLQKPTKTLCGPDRRYWVVQQLD